MHPLKKSHFLQRFIRIPMSQELPTGAGFRNHPQYHVIQIMAVAAWRCPQEKWYLAARNATDQTSRFDITKKDMMTMHWVWETVAFWCILGYSLYSWKRQKHTKNTLTSPYWSNAQSGARGIYHIVVLQECSCFGTSTRNIPSWKYQKNIQSTLVCHMLSYSNGHSGLFKWTNAGHLLTKTLFSAWNDWNKWKFRSTTNYKHVQMLIEI